jgi:signal transduction histidine kinase
MIGCTQKSTQSDNNPANDSVKKYLALAKSDSLDFNLRAKYNDKALSFIDLNKNDSLTIERLGRTSKNYLIMGENDKFLKVSKIFYKKILRDNDSLRLGQYYENKGTYFMKVGVFDSAFSYFLKSEKMFMKLNQHEKLGIVLTKKGIVQLSIDDYLGAELSSKKACAYLKKINSHERLVSSLMNLGNAYHNMQEYDKAIKTLNEAISLIKKYNIKNQRNKFSKGSCLNNIGNALREQKKYKEAIGLFKSALYEKNICKEDPELYAYLLNNIGYCYLKNNKNYHLPILFKTSRKIFDSLNIKNESAISDLYLSEYYSKNKDFVNANHHAESALKKSKEANAPYYYLTALTHAGSINPKKAPFYIQEFKRINDSLLLAERTARNQYYKIQLETEEINQQKETVLKQRTFLVVIAIAVFLIAILIVIIARQRLKQKELSLKNTQQKANEEIYQLMLVQKAKEEEARRQEKKRIALELHDGVMNKLTSTRLNLSVLSIKKDTDTVDRSLPHIDKIKEIENEIRNLTHNLNSKNVLGENSYEKLLSDLVTEQNQISATVFELKINPEVNWGKTTDIQKMNLYRILQEACQNIHKHSKAKKARIHFFIDNHKLCLHLSDDGIGIQPNKPKKGIGLKNIKYRVKELNGKFNVSSKVNQGTTLTVSIPL